MTKPKQRRAPRPPKFKPEKSTPVVKGTAGPRPKIVRENFVRLGRQAWQVAAPEGYRFKGDEVHHWTAWSQEEANQILEEPVEPCPTDCHCKESLDK